MVKASIIMSIFNDEKYLRDSIQSVTNQTETEIEIILIDNGSTDNSLQILQEYAENDARIIILRQNRHIEEEKIKNIGLTSAKGKYVVFISGHTVCNLEMMEKTLFSAEDNQADISLFNIFKVREDGSKKWEAGLNNRWLPPETTVFSYGDCPDGIMSILNPFPYNKLYRIDFLKNIILNFGEDILSNYILLSAVCAVYAHKICYVRATYIHSEVKNNIDYNVNTEKHLSTTINVLEEIKKVSYYNDISRSVYLFFIERYILLLNLDKTNSDFEEKKELYNFLHDFFNNEDIYNVEIKDLGDTRKWLLFNAVKKHDYESMKKLKSCKLIVSFTSFPARISYVPTMLESIVNQSLTADKIILYLAKEQFPERENELPETLLEYVKNGILDVTWCDDLRPHKKYFYAMQEYPKDLIVTLDEDLIYSENMLQKLYDSYLMYPEAISAMRTHLITLSEEGDILPYKYWLHELDSFLFKPTLYLFATTGAGTLFPPGLLPDVTFDKKVIRETCLNADDLWLKTAQLINNVPVVCASINEGLNYVPGSQEITLWKTNNEGGNDEQLAKIIGYFEKETNTNVWADKLTSMDSDENLSSKKNVCRLANGRYTFTKRKWIRSDTEKADISKKLSTANAEKADISKKLSTANAEKADISKKLAETNKEKEDINRKLTEANIEKTEISKKLAAVNVEKAEISKELEQTSKEKREMRERLKAKIDNIKNNKKKEKEKYELELKIMDEKIKAIEKEKYIIENSTTYKVGKIIMWIPTHIKNFLKRKLKK